MLTSDLAINFKRGGKIYPRLIPTDDKSYLEDAANLIEIFDSSQNQARHALEHELEEYVGTGTDYRILRGLIKLLGDRSDFAADSPVEPLEIRRAVFLEAAKFQPVLPNSETRPKVLQNAAEQLQTDAETTENNLYADLSAQQKMTSFDLIEPRDLLERYNLAQAQALLYKCIEMEIRVLPSDNANYRAIFGWIKHFGLIHTVNGNAKDGYMIKLTGAASLFHRSQKYGVKMSVFLPALLLCQNWLMRAEIAQKQGANIFYELSSEQQDLTSCYFDEPEYVNSDIERLKKNWDKYSDGWQLKENREVVDLGKTAFIPDSVMISPAGAKIFLDVLGFWTPKTLLQRLDEFRAAGFNDFLFAASHELRGTREEPLWESENVYFYKTKIEPRTLIEMAIKISTND